MLNRFVLLFLSGILLLSCAKGYRNFGYHDSYQEVSTRGKDVTVKVAVKDFGLNKQLQKKADDMGLLIRRVSIFNISNKAFDIDYADFKVVAGGIEYPALTSKETFKKIKNIPISYMLYALIAVPVDEDFSPTIDPDEITYPIPLGLPFGLANALVSAKYNGKLKKELDEYVWSYTSIPPGKTRAGLVYFKVPGGVYDELIIQYTKAGQKIRFKINDIEPGQ